MLCTFEYFYFIILAPDDNHKTNPLNTTIAHHHKINDIFITHTQVIENFNKLPIEIQTEKVMKFVRKN